MCMYVYTSFSSSDTSPAHSICVCEEKKQRNFSFMLAKTCFKVVSHLEEGRGREREGGGGGGGEGEGRGRGGGRGEGGWENTIIILRIIHYGIDMHTHVSLSSVMVSPLVARRLRISSI